LVEEFLLTLDIVRLATVFGPYRVAAIAAFQNVQLFVVGAAHERSLARGLRRTNLTNSGHESTHSRTDSRPSCASMRERATDMECLLTATNRIPDRQLTVTVVGAPSLMTETFTRQYRARPDGPIGDFVVI
jgi:hypothetical protein